MFNRNRNHQQLLPAERWMPISRIEFVETGAENEPEKPSANAVLAEFSRSPRSYHPCRAIVRGRVVQLISTHDQISQGS